MVYWFGLKIRSPTFGAILTCWADKRTMKNYESRITQRAPFLSMENETGGSRNPSRRERKTQKLLPFGIVIMGIVLTIFLLESHFLALE